MRHSQRLPCGSDSNPREVKGEIVYENKKISIKKMDRGRRREFI